LVTFLVYNQTFHVLALMLRHLFPVQVSSVVEIGALHEEVTIVKACSYVWLGFSFVCNYTFCSLTIILGICSSLLGALSSKIEASNEKSSMIKVTSQI